jgi:hypothetical protein
MKGSNARFIFANGYILQLAFSAANKCRDILWICIIQILKENHRLENKKSTFLLNGLSHERDFKKFDKNLQNLA